MLVVSGVDVPSQGARVSSWALGPSLGAANRLHQA